jgi:cation diffusion facilitator family transporter
MTHLTTRHDGDHDDTVGPGDHVHPHDHHPRGRGLRAAIRDIVVPHSHDASDSVDDALESHRDGIRAVKISLAVLAATAAGQAVIVALSGSVALAADTIHNVSDALTALPLWIAFAVGRRAATRRYTYGFGRVEDLAGLFVLTMIALSAILAGYESVRRLMHPVPIDNIGWVAAAGLIGFLGNELVALYRIRVGRRIGSAALVADGVHARTDGFTSLAVVAGAAGVWLGVPLADPLIGLVITVAIAVVLRSAAREVFRRLLDGVDPRLVVAAEHALAEEPGVLAVEQVRMRWIGHRLHAEAVIDVKASTSVAQADQVSRNAEHALTHAVPRLAAASIRARPASAAKQ